MKFLGPVLKKGNDDVAVEPLLGAGTTLIVAANNSSANDKSKAHYVCDGTADDVEINAALTAVKTAGGVVDICAGTFAIASTLAVIGDNTSDSPMVSLLGKGPNATIFNVASGVHGITLTATPKVRIEDIGFSLAGSSDGIRCIAPTTGATDRRGFWMSRFVNLRFLGDFAGTGWAMNMESPFRSTFINIQSSGVKNGFWLKSHYASFNPGNCVFIDCHIEILANGTAYFLDTADTGGFFNIMMFIECDCYDGTGSTTSIGWRFKGSTTTYFTTRDIRVIHSNVEGFNTAVSIEHSAGITFHGAYIDTKTNGTVFHCSSDSVNNFLSGEYIYVPSPKTTKAINDLNTDPLKPNTFRDCFARVETGGTLTITKSAATVLEKLYRDSDGSGVYPSEWQGQTTGLVVQNEGTELFRGTRKINFVGAGVDVTNSGPDATVTISGGGAGVSDGDKGDVTVSGTGTVWTIDNNVVTFAKMQDIATARILGRNTASTGDIEELTAATTKTLLALVKGDVGLGNVDNTSDTNKPVSTAQQTALDLKANDADVVHDTGAETIAGVKTFSSDPLIPDEVYGVGWNGSLEPPTKNAVYDKIETVTGGGVSDGDKGDITISGTGTIFTIDNDVVTYAKMQNVSATARIMGRNTSGAGDMEELDASTVKTMLALNNVTNTSDASKPVSTAQQTAIDAKNNLVMAINAPTANYTLVLGDGTTRTLVRMNVASANTLTIPPNSSVAFAIGTVIEGKQIGAGQTTLTPGSGVTLNAADSKLKTRVQHSGFSLVKVATDAWDVFGDLAT